MTLQDFRGCAHHIMLRVYLSHDSDLSRRPSDPTNGQLGVGDFGLLRWARRCPGAGMSHQLEWPRAHLTAMSGILCPSYPRPVKELVDHHPILDGFAPLLRCDDNNHRSCVSIDRHKFQRALQMAVALGPVAASVCRRREHQRAVLLLAHGTDRLLIVCPI